MINEKYFTNEMIEVHRKELFSVLGLESLHYIYVESVGDVFIRVDEIKGNESIGLLPITSRATLTKYCEEKLLPLVEFRSSEANAVLDSSSKQSLWKALFPFPICKIGKNTTVQPVPFETELFQLMEVLGLLEQKLAVCEVGLVTFAGRDRDCHLLFHFVRGVRVRLGIPEDFDSYLSTFRGAAPTISDLEGYFGTSTAYARVEVPEVEVGASALGKLSSTILNAIPSIATSSRRAPETTEPAQIQL